MDTLREWLELASAVLSLAVSLGFAVLVRAAARFFWERYRWNTFDHDLQKWLAGEGKTQPRELDPDEWRFHVACLLKDAQFAPQEAQEVLDFAVSFARGREAQYEVA